MLRFVLKEKVPFEIKTSSLFSVALFIHLYSFNVTVSGLVNRWIHPSSVLLTCFFVSTVFLTNHNS